MQQKHEIIADNKLIAEFMGIKIIDEQSIRPDLQAFRLSEVGYHKSWDWLMPVFEKIQYIDDNNSEFFEEYYSIDFKIDLLNGVDFKIDKKRIFMQTAYGSGQLIDAVWAGVIAFIKWFNEHKLCKNN